VKTFSMPQHSREWYEIRRGIPTASNANKIITPKTGKLSASADGYIDTLIAERIHLSPDFMTEKPMSRDMANGLNMEPEARSWYALQNDSANVQIVGFCLTDDGRFGCSPDSLVNDNSGLEMKCPSLATHIGYLRHKGSLLEEYKCQVHFSLIVTGREFWEIMSYVPDLDPILIRVEPDSFTAKMQLVLDEFHGMYIMALREVAPHLLKPHEIEPAKPWGGELFSNPETVEHP
jgi:hypothetical protein